MEMTLLTWRFDRPGTLIGCGVDVETVDRFQSVAENDDHSMPFVFTQKEIVHARRQLRPAQTLCVAFSCKESLFKALRRPYNYTQCETFPVLPPFPVHPVSNTQPSMYEGPVHLSPDPTGPFGSLAATMRAFPNPKNNTEMITTVYIFKEERP